jgi:putative lipoprotein
MLKNLLFLLLVFSLTACAVTAQHNTHQHKTHQHKHDAWFGEDKAYHFFASSVIGAAATKVALNNQAAPCDAVIIGISSSFVIGAGKEWYDLKVRKTFFSWKDMAWDIAGGTLGSFAVGGC